MPQQEPPGVVVDADPVVIGPQPGPMGAQDIDQGSPSAFRPVPMPPPSPPQVHSGHSLPDLTLVLFKMINIDDSPELPRRALGLPGVSIASDFMPLVNSTRSRMLELNVEYRDSMIHLKVRIREQFSGECYKWMFSGS